MKRKYKVSGIWRTGIPQRMERDMPTTIDTHVQNLERMAKAICSAWPKTPDGCAAICMDRLGCIPPEGCRYAIEVHGNRARAALTTGKSET